MVTPHIEDESPLTVQVSANGIVEAFHVPLTSDSLVTSGVYYFSADVLFFLNKAINSGKTKMRNFLSDLVEAGHIIKIFKVQKSLDIDRPEDIISAEKFPKGSECD